MDLTVEWPPQQPQVYLEDSRIDLKDLESRSLTIVEGESFGGFRPKATHIHSDTGFRRKN